MPTIAENLRIFHLYSDLLPELRMMVINEMRADDRCRFTRCSKSSRSEAMSSKKYILELQMRVTPAKDIVLLFVTYDKINMGYFYQIERENNDKNTYIKYIVNDRSVRLDVDKRNNEAWRIELDPHTEIIELGLQWFNKLLASYQNKIKRLVLHGDCEHWVELDITSLRNLEELIVTGSSLAPEILSKTNHPLKKLKASRAFTIYDTPQIYQVRDHLVHECLKLTNKQFLRLTASKIDIHIGYLTVNNIHNFIKSWQNGTIRRNMTMYSWVIDSGFDVRALFRRFGMFQGNEVMIKHKKEDGKSAKLFLEFNTLQLHFKDGV